MIEKERTDLNTDAGEAREGLSLSETPREGSAADGCACADIPYAAVQDAPVAEPRPAEVPAGGLSPEDVFERRKKGLANGSMTVPTKSVKEILMTNLLTPFHALNLGLALAILIFGDLKNALFMIVVILNAAVGIVQELRAKRKIDALSLISAPKAVALRGGEEVQLPSAELVLDDIMRLSPGFQVCADAVVTEGSCHVDESLLTGEDEPVQKRPGDELFSGSFIISGRCHARVVHVGAENYAAKISQKAKYLKKPASEIMKAVNRIIKTVAIAIVPIGAALFCRQYFLGGVELGGAVTSTVAALVGMIPEGLVLLTSVVLAVGIVRLARHRALVQELYSIEMLARVDTLCLDKTGTLTEGRMNVERTTGPAGDIAAFICNYLQEENPTALAVRAACPEPAVSRTAKKGIPFSSARKWSGVELEDGGILAMGAAQFVLSGRDDLYAQIRKDVDEAASAGLRVLAVVSSDSGFGTDGDEPRLPEILTLEGLIILSDVIRASAPETIRYFIEQGVDIKIISGDDPETVSQIAARCGVPGHDRIVDMSREPMVRASDYTVFGRVTPDQKLQLVKELRSDGHVVAMMGDGVNDVMALKESDCSVAPASGSDAARNVSQIVLLDSDFASLPRVVAEGRRSINNLQRSASLFLTKTIFSAVAAVLFIFLNFRYPLEPIHMTLIAGLTIGAPSFVLALQPNRERVKGHFLSNVLSKAFPGALADIVAIVLSTVILEGRLDPPVVSAVCAMLLALVGFLVLFKVCLPFDALRAALFTVLLGAYVGVLFIVPGFFSLLRPTWMVFRPFLTLGAVTAAAWLLFVIIWNKIEKRLLAGA